MLSRIGWCLAVTVGALQACGGKAAENERQADARGGSAQVEPSTGGTPNSSPSGSMTAGTSHGTGTGGITETGGTTQTGGGVSHPLIMGDSACPAEGPLYQTCTVPEAVCVYRGLQVAQTDLGHQPMRCACMDGHWLCVRSDDQGNSACADSPPVPSRACDTPGVACSTVISWPMGIVCNVVCTEDETGDGGAGGAATPASTWQVSPCAL